MTTSPLQHFLGYFHQDWQLDHSDEEGVIADYVRREPGARLLPPDIDRVLRENPTESETRRCLAEMGNEYRADWNGGTYRAWLQDVARRIETALADRD